MHVLAIDFISHFKIGIMLEFSGWTETNWGCHSISAMVNLDRRESILISKLHKYQMIQ